MDSCTCMNLTVKLNDCFDGLTRQKLMYVSKGSVLVLWGSVLV